MFPFRECLGSALLLFGVAWDGFGGEPWYRLIPLEDTPDPDMALTIANGLTDRGTVAGYGISKYDSIWRGRHLVIYFDRLIGYTNLGTVPGFGCRGIDVNDAGQIAVTCGGDPQKAYRYTPGRGFEDLGSLGADPGFHNAFAINQSGQVAGRSQLTDGKIVPYRYTDGAGMVSLGGLGGGSAWAGDINAGGWVVGSDLAPDGSFHAYVWMPKAGVTDLGPGFGNCINDSGMVAGLTGSGFPATPTLFKGTNVVRIPSPPGSRVTGLGRLNEAGIVVGGYRDGVGCAFAASEATGFLDLSSRLLTNGASGWVACDATAINNHGQIAASAYVNGRTSAVLLDPIPPKLSIMRRVGDGVLSWAPAWPGLVVEAAESLVSTQWIALPASSTNAVSFSATGTMRFFRLNTAGAAGWCCAPEPFITRPRPPFTIARVSRPPLLAAGVVFYDPTAHTVVAGDGVHATVTLQGVAHDPELRPLAVSWSEAVSNTFEIIARTEVVTNTFTGPGRHELRFVASDGTLSATNSLVLDLVTPARLVTAVVAFIDGRKDQNPGSGAFVASLRRAVEAFDGGDYAQGLHDLKRALAMSVAPSVVQDPDAANGIVYLLDMVVAEVERAVTK